MHTIHINSDTTSKLNMIQVATELRNQILNCGNQISSEDLSFFASELISKIKFENDERNLLLLEANILLNNKLDQFVFDVNAIVIKLFGGDNFTGKCTLKKYFINDFATTLFSADRNKIICENIFLIISEVKKEYPQLNKHQAYNCIYCGVHYSSEMSSSRNRDYSDIVHRSYNITKNENYTSKKRPRK